MISALKLILTVFLAISECEVIPSRRYFPLLSSSYNTKSWIKKTPQSWRDWNTRVPLGDINFPTDLEVPIAFVTNKDSMSCEIVIPMDDVVDEGNFDPPTKSLACPREAGTLPEEDILWLNPENWQLTVSGKVNRAIPHVERLPCTHDIVRFGSELGDFIVMLPNKKINIQRMNYEGSVVGYFNSESSLKKEAFIKHFIVYGEQDATTLFNFTRKDCQDRTGCVCGTKQFLKEVCELIEPKCNLTLPCSRPIKPVGHCCLMCGTYIEMFFDKDKFIYQKFYLTALQKLQDISYNYYYHFSKLTDGSLHVVFTMDENEHNENDLYKTAADFAKFIKNVENLGILDYRITSSGSVFDPQTWIEMLRYALYVIVSIVLLIAGYYFCADTNRKRVYSVFSAHKASEFVKFENSAEESHGEESVEKKVDAVSSNESSEEEKSDSDVFVELQISNEADAPP